MHAIVTQVTINDAEAATEALSSRVVPQVSQAPGFVAGYWVRVAENKGVSVVAFESEDAARQASEHIEPPGDFVNFDSIEVGEVVASA
jgi:heme-degrading monooxygenase HmoA